MIESSNLVTSFSSNESYNSLEESTIKVPSLLVSLLIESNI